MSENIALWLPKKRGDFEVGPAPTPHPGTGEILIRTRAVAVNPFERMIRTVGDIVTPWLAYPAILGSDVAGEVLAVGAGVTRFAVGDRVLGFALGCEKGRRAAEGGFQTHTILTERMATHLPDDLAFQDAAALPLAVSTAAAGLFQKDYLAMEAPSPLPRSAGRTLIVWGGSTSVGCAAIQLAVAAGYDVIATASPHNADYLRALGAQRVFDRKSPTVVRDIIADLQGREVSGALAIGPGSARACIDILAASNGNRFVATVTTPTSLDDVPAGRGRWRKLVPRLMQMVALNVALTIRGRARGVRSRFIWGATPAHNEVGPMIFADFLPSALRDGRFVAAPRAVVVGEGLEWISEALERQRRGVSAQKLVVMLP